MKKVLVFLFFLAGLFLSRGDIFAGNIGDPGTTLNEGGWSLGPEFSGVAREIRDGDGIRYDTESWRLLLKGSYGITDWLEGFARAGGVTLKIRGTPFDSNPGWAAGAGLKATFLDPPAIHCAIASGGSSFTSKPETGIPRENGSNMTSGWELPIKIGRGWSPTGGLFIPGWMEG